MAWWVIFSHTLTDWSEARQQVCSSRLSTSLFTSFSPSSYFLPLAPCLSLRSPASPPPPPPPPLLSPSPLKGTLLGQTVCVTSWAGRSQWGTQLCVQVCLHLCIHVCSEHFVFFNHSPHENVLIGCIKPFSRHTHRQTSTHTRSHLSVILQHSSTAGSRGRRWRRRLMDMFVYLFVLDMINWSAG